MEVQQVLDHALAGHGTDNFIFPLFTKQGARVEVLLNATPRRNESDAVVGVLGVGQDITRIAKAQNELRQVAHDLKQVGLHARSPYPRTHAPHNTPPRVRAARCARADPAHIHARAPHIYSRAPLCTR